MNGEAAIGLTALGKLLEQWSARCKVLAGEGKYWEAGRLSEAANELRATMNNPLNRSGQALGHILTDQQVSDAYERMKREPTPLDKVLPPRTVWPAQWPPNQPGIYQPPLDIGTRITD